MRGLGWVQQGNRPVPSWWSQRTCPVCVRTLCHQVLLALVDQRYFGEQRVATGATGEAWGEACHGLASVPYIPGECDECR